MYSVVIPLYNKKSHISRAIKSVINQTFPNFELIVVDDGSTDFSVDEVKKFNDIRIRLIQQPNLGVSAARNKGIKEAFYDYIAFLDADDAWKPDFLFNMSQLIEKYPEAGAYATGYEIKANERNLTRCIEELPNDWVGIVDDYFKHSINKPLITASSVVIPKKVFFDIGLFDEHLKRGEDLDMWLRIALNYKIAFTNKVCSIYYHDSDNRACKKEIKLEYSISDYAEEKLKKGRTAKYYSFYFEEYMIRLIIGKARYYIRLNKRKEARKLLLKYKKTKCNREYLVKTYILSLLPSWLIGAIRSLRRRLIDSRL